MPISITSTQIQLLLADVEAGNITAAYDYLSSQGYAYADWANGVAQGNTIAGASALEFLQGTALVGIGSLACQMLSPETIQSIKQGMAREYLNVLAGYAEDDGGATARDINAHDVWKIHEEVFIDNGLGIENWTLDAPFRIVEKLYGSAVLEDFWTELRETSGDNADATAYNLLVLWRMYVWTGSSDPEIRGLAENWMQNVPVGSGLYNDMQFGNAFDDVIDLISSLSLKDSLTDLGGGILDFIIPPAYGDVPLSEHPIIFGSEDSDTLNGSDNADLLYGGSGDDSLEGNDGNDFLEGGVGYDTYRIDSGDILQDSDGKGDVWLSGQQLHGGEKEEDEDIWKDDLGNTYQMSGNTLLIQGSGGGITIKQFSNHTLGIHLVDNYFLDENIRSPIALDLNGDGLATTTLQGGAYFDHGNDGFAEQTAWLNREDGLLALDRDGNGSIDNGLELFGSRTLLSNGQYADNGYEALAEFDDNGDGQIDAQDSAYTTIMIWQDRNGDGESGSEELLTMAVAQVQSIATAYTETFQDDNGNPILQTGNFTKADGGIGASADIWFQTDETWYTPSDLLPETSDIAALPNAPGFQHVYDMHQSMLRDSTGHLQALVQQFVEVPAADRFILIDSIIFAWLGVENVPAGSRGGNIDARKMTALEVFSGDDYFQTGWGSNPAPNAAEYLNNVYDDIAQTIYRQLMDSHFTALLDSIQFFWNDAAGQFDVDVTDTIAGLQSLYDQGSGDFSEITAFADTFKSEGDLGSQLLSALRLQGHPGSGFAGVLWTLGYNKISGDAASNNLNGVDDEEWVFGLGGNDVLIGNGGGDILQGDTGNDILQGGLGNDFYLFNPGDGSDVVLDLDSTVDNLDTLVFGDDITPEDVTVSRTGADLILNIGNTGDQLIMQSFGMKLDYRIEAVKFVDGMLWRGDDLLDMAIGIAVTGSNGDDVLMSWYGEDGSLEGGAGNDQLFGNNGSDWLDGGEGADSIAGSTGDDYYVLDNSGDVVIELGGQGDDTIERGYNIYNFLENNVENLVITGNVYYGNGNALDNDLMGNNVANNMAGFDGDDTLYGFGGNDALFGVNGVDTMFGGAGDDYYEVDNINDITVEWSNDGNDEVHSTVSYVLSDNVERLTADGAANISVTGNSLGNGLWGNSGNNIMIGLTGNDYLVGNTGNDVYVFNRGDGQDYIDNYDVTAASDTLHFGEGIADTDILAFQSGSSLLLKIKDRADTITIAYYYDTDIINGGGAYDHKIDRVEFANGVVWDQTILQTQVNRSLYNQVPVVSNEIPALNAMAGDQLTYQVPINTITDLDIWDTIHYSAELEDGSPLPSWLQFDADTRTFSGVPTETGILQLLVWGIDDYGHGVGENFTLNIQSGSNIAPVLSLPVPDQAVNEGEIFSYTLPENTFIDANGNNTLSYSVTLTDAGSLPSWLSFNTGTFTFYGASPVGALGTFSIKITAIDSGHVMVSDIFDLQINIQDLTLNGTDNADMLLGRSGNDSLIAGAGNDTLNGSAGGDALTGGSGDDTYVIDNKLDLVTEYANEGIDQINSSVSYDLPDEVENIVLTGGLAINSTGNTLDNLMIGNDARNILFGVVGADTMIGGLGNDTYGVNNVGDVVVETSTLAAEIDEVISSIDYLLGDNLEDLILNGDAAINGTGNTLNNEIIGNAANNVLDGSTGADTLVGDLGNDTYIIDNNSDVVTEISTLATEVDTVLSSVSYTLDANTENLSLTGTSSINGTGNELSNIIIGNINNNVLDGGASTDTLLGSLGDDVYNVDNIRDKVVEVINEGIDQVNSSVSFTLSANTENLTLTGSVAINGTGNSIANNMTGNSGDNILAGGEGADILNGGGGNDTYVVNITALGETEDTIVAGSGIDTLELVNDYYTGPRIALTLAAAIENYNIARTRHAYLDMIGNSEDNILTGNKADNTLDGGTGEDILAGGLGNDFYLVDKSGDVIIEEVGEGTDQVNSSVSYALPVEVEMLTLTGSSLTSGTGNEQANTIVGNSNDNTLDGRTGGDNLIGGLGNDVYMVDNASDVVIEYMNGGNDQVNSSISYTLSEQLENLTLVDTFDINGTGNDLINVITGNGAGNILSGGAGNDVLSGGSGIDTLIGGLGDDSYIVDNTSDVVIETANEGADQVSSSVTYTLSTEVESLTLTGSSAINGIGNNLANSITGNSGGNILTGGAGSDTLTGGGGSDTYVVNLTALGELEDAVVAGTGIDTLKLLGNYLGSTLTLMTAISIEHVDVSGTGSSLLDLTGNMTNNTLTGNAANNILDGAAGNDTLLGGLGNDNYLVDSSADIVTEAASAGADTVQSIATSYILGSNVENLVLTGAGNTSGSGNSLVNVITGNIGNNILSGGSGADTLVGGLGNDIYIVDNASDVVIETANEGADQISSSVTYTLSTEVESLTLTGSSAINGIGNNLANSITGNSGGNILTGGAGSDTLTGGGGSDTYVVNLTALGELEDAVVAGTGIDTLKLLGSYTGQLITLTAATAIENYDIAGTGSALLNLTGNTSNNTLTGNSGSNILIGGAGTDTLRGSGGADTYIVNITAVGTLEDTVIAGAGTDTLQLVGSYSGASITLTAATAIENYDISGTGSALLNLTGNTSNNSLIGNSSDNTFKGLAGNDVLRGGNGADTFWFDTAANSLTNKDTLTDFATGVDKLKFSLSALSALGLSGQFSAGDQRFNQSSNGLALDATDRLIYNTTTGELNYDSNGNVAGGTQAALLILNGLPNLADTDIFAV